MPPVVLRQAQHGHAVALDGLDRHQVLVVEPVRHAEQRAARMRSAARPRSASPRRRSAAPGRAPRRRPPSPSAATCAAKASSVSGSPNRASSAARKRRAVEAGRIGVFLHRLALHEQPLAGMDRIERRGLARQRRVSASMPNSVATKSSRCGPSATTSSLSSWPTSRRARRAPPAGARAAPASSPASRRGTPVEPDQPVAGGEVGVGEAEAQAGGIGRRDSVHRRGQIIFRGRGGQALCGQALSQRRDQAPGRWSVDGLHVKR